MDARVVLLGAVVFTAPHAAFATSACDEGPHGPRVVAVSGARFPSLRGRAARELRAWAWHGRERVAVPFQVDECEADGHVVVGPPGAASSDARLGPRAVVLFRTADA